MTKEQKGKYFITNYDLEAMPPSYSNLPQSFLKAMYIRSLIGPVPELLSSRYSSMISRNRRSCLVHYRLAMVATPWRLGASPLARHDGLSLAEVPPTHLHRKVVRGHVAAVRRCGHGDGGNLRSKRTGSDAGHVCLRVQECRKLTAPSRRGNQLLSRPRRTALRPKGGYRGRGALMACFSCCALGLLSIGSTNAPSNPRGVRPSGEPGPA